MTDRFEEAVRDAVQGLPSASGEMPTYHDAWQRGRRRRLVKRSALAAAGVAIFVAALTVNLGRIPGPGTTETDDVATGIDAPTTVFEPTPLATTSPLETPDPAAASSTAPALQIPTSTPRPDPAAAADATESAPPPVSEPAATATPVPPVPAPTTPAAEPTAVPTASPVPESPTTVPTPSPLETGEADPSATGPATPQGGDELQDETDPDFAAGTAQQPQEPGSPDDPPQLAFTGPGTQSADAVVLDEASDGAPVPCDLDGDLVADASCELLSDYSCTGNGDVRPGYAAVDSNGDQRNDLCIAVGITGCDIDFDGLADIPCIIELIPTNETDG